MQSEFNLMGNVFDDILSLISSYCVFLFVKVVSDTDQ